MNRHINAIAGRLSLRHPQRQSLEILDRVCDIAPPSKDANLEAALAAIRSEYPTVTDFERDFPSLCFALATGVGKTRLMGAFIAYLHLAHGINNFFVMAPNLTIYNKLIADFSDRGHPKYVFKGIAEFATSPPEIVTGDNYEQRATAAGLYSPVTINIFNISKINTEVRGGRSPRIKRLSEYIGQSYFDYLASLPDLVLLMDESHRYRASAGVRAINELRPVLGLELTATPFVETGRGTTPFQNVIFDYPLGRAMADGFVKEPAVVTRKDFNPAGMSQDEIERLKLEDGVRLHESVKVELETYARESGNVIVKPFLLVIARDITHAGQLIELIKSDSFFSGHYNDKVIQVDSSRTGAEEEAMIERLLKVEHTDEPTEIVIHVNMLKEGWDVTNLYTIVPLRAANARTLIEQSIGRGLRLPYGRRTGVSTVDRLNIIAHDRFQEIVDEANRPDSTIRMQQVILDPNNAGQTPHTVVSQPLLSSQLGLTPSHATANTVSASHDTPIFRTDAEKAVARITVDVIRRLEAQPQTVPTLAALSTPAVKAMVLEQVRMEYQPQQIELEGVSVPPDLGDVVNKTLEVMIGQSISIPRILIVPKGEVCSGFHPFTLDVQALNYQPPSEELWVQFLRTGAAEIVGLTGNGGIEEKRLEDYVVGGLMNFDDVSYDDHADLLYDLSGQVVRHFLSRLSEDDARRVLRVHQTAIANFVHAQMQDHYWEEAVDFEVVVSKGFTALKDSAYTANDNALDFRVQPADRSNMAKYLFNGFSRCLYPVQKFDSDTERVLAVILDRDVEKWFRPAKGQFQIFYRWGSEHREYQPDFVAETADAIYMLEPKARNQMDAAEVLAKADAARRWCEMASNYATSVGGKNWQYTLIPHDLVAENMSLPGLVAASGTT